MFQFSESIQPYTSLDECGDFSLYEESDDHVLIIVGDLGGHGHPILGKTVLQLKSILRESKMLDLLSIFEKIRLVDIIQQLGLAIFIGKLNKKTCELNYLSTGNLTLQLLHQQSTQTLPNQTGIVYLYHPSAIELQSVTLTPTDKVVISTDGVLLDDAAVFNTFNGDFSPAVTVLSQHIINRHSDHNDDSLCVVFSV